MLTLKYLLKGGRKWRKAFTKYDTPESLELMKQEAKTLGDQNGWRAVIICRSGEVSFIWEYVA